MVIIIIAVFAVFLGLCILSFSLNTAEILEVSDTWVVELEPHLNLPEKELMRQIQLEELGGLQILKAKHMSDYLEIYSSASFINVVGDLPPTENRYVLYIHEDSINSKEETRKILTDIDGIVSANELSFKVSGGVSEP